MTASALTLALTIILALTVFTSISIAYADDGEYTRPTNINVLLIGNSFGVDAAQHLNAILSSADVNGTVGVLYYGSCSLAMHRDNAENNKAVYTYYKNDGNGWNQNMGVWPMGGNSTMSEVLSDVEWDVITLQQASGSSGEAETYNDDLDWLIGYVKEHAPQAKLGWHMTWAYQSDSSHVDFTKYDYDQMKMYEAIVNATQTQVLTRDDFEFVVPNGTTIQNMRTSRFGDALTIDGYHLSRPIGRYAAALTFAKTLIPDLELNAEIALGGVDGVTDEEYAIISEAVEGAIAKPYGISYSTHVNMDGYDEMDWTAVSGFWTRGEGLNFAFLTTPSYPGYEQMAKMYVTVASQLTEDDLPKGTVIEISAGYSLTPVGWNADGVQSADLTIASIAGPKTVVVDDSWWNNCKHRVFNVNGTYYNDLSESLDAVKEAIKIYTPKKTNEPEINFDDYILFECDLIDNAYWFSTDATTNSVLNTPSNTTFTNHGLYVSSRGMFTRDNLPIGSVIVVEQGYQYRPEGWVTLGQNTTRENNVSTHIVIVDEEWWGDYQYRAFNVSSRAGDSLLGKTEEVKTKFRIYIPKDAQYSSKLYYPAGSEGNNELSQKHIVLIAMCSILGISILAAGTYTTAFLILKKRKKA